METRRPLDVIDVQEPCGVSMKRMSTTDRSQFCNHCRRDVHNISAMTASEAERLVCESAGRV